MKRTCDDISDLAAAGEQGVEVRPEVVDHLAGCARCRREFPALLAAARAIRSAPVTALAGHPAAEQIVALASESLAAGLEIDPGAAEHVAGCATCSAEVREVRRAEQARSMVSERASVNETEPSGAFRRFLASLAHGPIPARLAWVTSLGVLLLAYPAFQGLRHLPRVQEELGSLEQRARQLENENRGLSTSLAEATRTVDRLGHWTGPSRLFALSSPLRGQTSKQTIRLDPGEPYVLVSVRPILPERSADSDVYRFVVRRADGSEAWRSDLTVEAIRSGLRASGALIFPIPSALLTQGGHELRVAPERNPGEAILQIPFVIEPGG